jgi:hypothetical protein
MKNKLFFESLIEHFIRGCMIGLLVTAAINYATADELEVSIPIAAYHIGAPGQNNYLGHPYNDSQYKSLGLLLNYRVGDEYYAGTMVGSYENSWFHRSNLAGLDFGRHISSHLNVGLIAGAVTGYGSPEKIKPALAPYVELKDGPASIGVTYLQSTTPQVKSALALTIGYHF